MQGKGGADAGEGEEEGDEEEEEGSCGGDDRREEASSGGCPGKGYIRESGRCGGMRRKDMERLQRGRRLTTRSG